MSRVLSVGVQVAVEQMLARRRSDEYITSALGITVAEVEYVRRYLDTIHNSPDHPELQVPIPGSER